MAYSIGAYRFDPEAFCPRRILDLITEVRVSRPGLARQAAEDRVQPEQLTRDGKLTIMATDHPARRINKVGNDPLAMADRGKFLGRILRVIAGSDFDGVMGPTDIIEELLIVHALIKEAGGPGFLDNKVVLGSMNRGGVQGAQWELDDRFTSWTAEAIAAMRLDGGKMVLRIDDTDVGSLDTLEACVLAINDLNALGLPCFFEPLAARKVNGKPEIIKEAEALAIVAGVASSLGDSSLGMWLKLPYCTNYEKVARATTLPILMLGGEAKDDPTPMLREFAAGMQAGANVRGALVGRNILFPGLDDPYATAMAVHRIVHAGYTVEQAADYIVERRGENMNALTRWLK